MHIAYCKKFLPQALTPCWRLPPPLPPGEGGRGGGSGFVRVQCVHFETLAEFFCRLYSFVGVRGVSSKTIKTGLNCRQELSTRD